MEENITLDYQTSVTLLSSEVLLPVQSDSRHEELGFYFFYIVAFDKKATRETREPTTHNRNMHVNTQQNHIVYTAFLYVK